MALFSDNDEVFYLDREDREQFVALVAEMKRRGGGKGVHHVSKDDDHLAPEVYVARTPSGGIPSLDANGTGTSDDDVPGSAVCTVYNINLSTEVLTPVTGFTRTVYNIHPIAVEGSTWIVVARDKYGRWLHIAGGINNRMEHIKVTSNTATGGYYPGKVRVLSGTSWSDGVTVKVVIAEGTCFIPDQIYWGKYQGQVGGVDVYSCSGNDKHIVQYSVDTGSGCEDRCDCWFIPAPFKVNTNIDCSGTGAGTSP